MLIVSCCDGVASKCLMILTTTMAQNRELSDDWTPVPPTEWATVDRSDRRPGRGWVGGLVVCAGRPPVGRLNRLGLGVSDEM